MCKEPISSELFMPIVCKIKRSEIKKIWSNQMSKRSVPLHNAHRNCRVVALARKGWCHGRSRWSAVRERWLARILSVFKFSAIPSQEITRPVKKHRGTTIANHWPCARPANPGTRCRKFLHLLESNLPVAHDTLRLALNTASLPEKRWIVVS